MNRTAKWLPFLVFLAGVCPHCSYPQAASHRRLAIPSYVSPTSAEWNRWASPGSQAVGIMILNRNNGDDVSVDSATAAAIRKTRNSGILVLGYIHTGYAHRDLAEIRARIDGVYAAYGVDGIFLDETPVDCGAIGPMEITNLAYYQELSKFIRTKPGRDLVVLNPGATPATDCWMSATDVLVTFEQATLERYRNTNVDAPWTRSYGSERFLNLIYGVSSDSDMKAVIALAKQRRVGWLYVTDDGPDGNPWDNPATYLASEARNWAGDEPASTPSPAR